MNPEPFSFQYPIADFDLTKLPVDAALLQANPTLLTSAIQTFYQESFRPLGGTATIRIAGGVVSVSWVPTSGDPAPQVLDYALRLLRRGDSRAAEPVLRALLARDPNQGDALFNLGMVLSDQRRLDEAMACLTQYVDLVPDSSPGWTALGVAQARHGDTDRATATLQRALELAPDNAHALRNLGAILILRSPEKALPVLKRAAQRLPDDQPAQYGYAACLLELGRTSEADQAFMKAAELNPLSDIGEAARKARSTIAHQNLRTAVSGSTRPDAVQYCLEALQKFRELGDDQTRSITFEIAMLGRNGFDINKPTPKYTLRSFPGEFSGLQLVSWMYTGMKLIDPNLDAGIDLSAEFAEAKGLFMKPRNNSH